MTVIIGIEVPEQNYVIIAGDTQATYGGGLKEQVNKLKHFSLPQLNASIAITGDPSDTGGVYSNLDHKIKKLTDITYRKRKAEEALVLRGVTTEREAYLNQALTLPAIELSSTNFMQQFRDSIYEEQLRYKNLMLVPGKQGGDEPIISMRFIVGIVDKNGKTALHHVDHVGNFYSRENYLVNGSGILGGTYHVIEDGWRNDLRVKEGIELAVKAVQSPTEQVSSVGKGINIHVITADNIVTLEQYLPQVKFDKDKLIEQYERKVA